MQKRYFVGLGTNIAPATNMATMIDRLAATFGPVTISRIVKTLPYRMPTDAPFLNAVATFVTDRPPHAVKALFVEWEAAMGRDRNDPDRKTKDRPADLDILLVIDESADIPSPPDEPYSTPLLREVAALVGIRFAEGADSEKVAMTPTPIALYGASVGESPSAIDHDGSAGHVRVL